MRNMPHYGGHLYTSKRSAFETFTVRPVEEDDPRLYDIAYNLQKIKRKALASQLSGKIDPELIMLTANEDNKALVIHQVNILTRQGPNEVSSRPGIEYVVAEALNNNGLDIIGFGRSIETNSLDLENPKVNLGEIYVDPDYQNRGVGRSNIT